MLYMNTVFFVGIRSHTHVFLKLSVKIPIIKISNFFTDIFRFHTLFKKFFCMFYSHLSQIMTVRNSLFFFKYYTDISRIHLNQISQYIKCNTLVIILVNVSANNLYRAVFPTRFFFFFCLIHKHNCILSRPFDDLICRDQTLYFFIQHSIRQHLWLLSRFLHQINKKIKDFHTFMFQYFRH